MYTAGNNAFQNQGQTADVIRDASLRQKADETNGYLREAHKIMGDLEEALLGPQLRNVGATKGENADAPGHPGLRAVIDDASMSSAALVSRLSTLLGSL